MKRTVFLSIGTLFFWCTAAATTELSDNLSRCLRPWPDRTEAFCASFLESPVENEKAYLPQAHIRQVVNFWRSMPDAAHRHLDTAITLLTARLTGGSTGAARNEPAELLAGALVLRAEQLARTPDGLAAAERDLAEAIKLHPSGHLAYFARGRIHVERSRKPDAAVADLSVAIGARAKVPEYHAWRGRAHLLKHDPILAVRDYAVAEQLSREQKTAKQPGTSGGPRVALNESLLGIVLESKPINLSFASLQFSCMMSYYFGVIRLHKHIYDLPNYATNPNVKPVYSRTETFHQRNGIAWNEKIPHKTPSDRDGPRYDNIAWCDMAILAEPNDRTLYYYRGSRLRVAGNSYLAVANFNDGLQLKPGDLMLTAGRAGAFEEIREYEKALTDADAVGRMTPGNDMESELHRKAIKQVGELRKRLGR